MPYMSVGSLSYRNENEEKSVIRNYESDEPDYGMANYYRPAAEMTPGILSHYDRRSGTLYVDPWVHGPMPDPNVLAMTLGQLDPVEMEALKKLDRRVAALLMEEMKDPESRDVIKTLLRQPDPAKAIAQQITVELMEETGIKPPGLAGLEDLGKKKRGFKKFIKKVGKPVMKVAKKYGATIVTIAGAALAPFTGGASLAAATVIATGIKVAQEKKAAAAAKKLAKKEAKAMEAEAQKSEMSLRNQVNDFFAQNQQMFASVGITPDKWNAMSLDDKLGVMDKMAKGEMKIPESAPPVANVEPPTQEVPTPSEVPPPPPPVADGKFKVVVEGREVGAWATVEDAAKGALGLTSPGDRFDVIADGKSTGLRIRTGTGAVEVPANMAAQVNAMTPDQVKDSVAKAEGKKTGGFPIWLLAVPAAAVVAAVA
jgi:hypothetical protein